MSNRLAVTLCTSLPRVFYSPSLVTLSHSLSSCHSVYRLVVAQPYTNGRRPLSIATVVRIQSFTNTCILSQQVCLKDYVVCHNRLYQRRPYTYPVTYIHNTHTRAHGTSLTPSRRSRLSLVSNRLTTLTTLSHTCSPAVTMRTLSSSLKRAS